MTAPPLLELTNLTKSYHGARVLNVPNLRLSEGDRLQIVGPNGSGKSTLLRLLAGITLPSSGKIRTLRDAGWRIAFVPQTGGYVAELSLAENARVLASAYGRWDATLLAEPELLDAFGLSASLHTPMSELSEGTCRIIVMLAAICSQPTILIADEPFAGIDPQNQLKLQGYVLSRLAAESAYVFSSHATIDGIATIHISSEHLVQ